MSLETHGSSVDDYIYQDSWFKTNEIGIDRRWRQPQTFSFVGRSIQYAIIFVLPTTFHRQSFGPFSDPPKHIPLCTTNVFVVVVALWSEPNRKISLKVTTHIAHFVRLNAHRFHFFGHQFLFRAIDFACGSRMQDHDQLALPIVVVRCGVLRVFLGHANLWCDDDVDWWLYNGPFQVDFYNMLHCVSVTTGAGGCAGMNPSQLRVCCESIGQVGWPCITYAYILYTIRKGWIRRRSRTKLEIPHSV